MVSCELYSCKSCLFLNSCKPQSPKIPCRDCVCLPVCKSQISNSLNSSIIMLAEKINDVLYPKCTLLQEWVGFRCICNIEEAVIYFKTGDQL